MNTEKLIDDAMTAFTDREIAAPSRDHLRIALNAFEASLTRCGCPDCTIARRERTGLTEHDKTAVARVLHEIVYAPGANYDRAVPGVQEYMLTCAEKVAAALPWIVPMPEVALDEFAPGECDGSGTCPAPVHVHGCYRPHRADQCDSPDEYGHIEPQGEPSDAQYAEVDAFAERMRAELVANAHKGDHWQNMTVREAWGEISWHVGKLTGAIKAGDVAAIRELAADIANGALMLDQIIAVNLHLDEVGRAAGGVQ